jgi:hypothetical protein
VPVKSKVEISENFVAFSEYMNFKYLGLYKNDNFFFQIENSGFVKTCDEYVPRGILWGLEHLLES